MTNENDPGLKRIVLPYAGPEEMEKSATPQPKHLYNCEIPVGATLDEIDKRVGDKFTPVDPMKHSGFNKSNIYHPPKRPTNNQTK